ncbi:MAG: MATE family efflux transporter [Bacteroidota bacterium]
MVIKVFNYFKNLGLTSLASFFSGHVRTVKIKKNILAMLILRGMSIVFGFLLVPMTLHYLNPTNYGIWLTLTSVIGWFSFFDIGLGNGLRNKFAVAIAQGDILLARMYVSTTYAFLSAITGIVFTIFFLVNPFLDWSILLNAPEGFSGELSLLMLITFGFFCLRFVFGLIGTILIADQKPALNSLLEVLSNVISLTLIWILISTTEGSLLKLSIAVGFSTAIVPIGASFWFFNRKYKNVRPSWAFVKKTHASELVQLGLRFFLLQIVGVVIFSTSNVIIAQLFSPADVVPYNIAFKYYSIITMGLTIILSPFWSAYTEAYIRNDVVWIRRTIKVLRRGWYVAAIVVVVMSLFADKFYQYWIGKDIHVSLSISLSMGIYVLIIAWCNIYAYFINGTGKIQLQIISSVIIGIVNIPLAIFLAKYCGLGIAGVILAPSICILPGCILWPIQVKKIISGTATGIWAK